MHITRAMSGDAHHKISIAMLTLSAAASSTLLVVPKRMSTVPVATVGTLAWVALAAFVALQYQRETVSAKLVFEAITTAFAVAVAIPSRGSDDIWSYAMYGRIVAQHHSSPWTRLPTAFQSDPYYAKISLYWKAQGSVYGPAFVALAALVMLCTGTSALATRVVFQTIAALCVLATLVLLHRRGVKPVALACAGLNPLTIASVVNGAHNDAICGLCVLAAMFCIMDRRSKLAGLLAAIALCVKAIVFLPIGAMLVWSWFNRSKRDTLTTVGVAGIASLAMLIPAGLMDAFGPLRNSSDLINTGSVWWSGFEWYRKRLLDNGYARTIAFTDASHAAVTVATIVMLIFAVTVVWIHRHDDDPIIAVGGASLAYFLLAAYIQPWYLAWALPVLAMKYRSTPALIGAGYSALIMLSLQYWWHPPHRERPIPSLFSQPYLGLFEVAGVVAMVLLSLRRRRNVPKNVERRASRLQRS